MKDLEHRNEIKMKNYVSQTQFVEEVNKLATNEDLFIIKENMKLLAKE